MAKLKTYVLTISKTFLKGHPKAGQETGFKDAILEGRKIHTIRGNYGYWAHKLYLVRTGKAVLSVREWEGKPYSSKQVEIVKLDQSNGVGGQPIFMTFNGWQMEATVANSYINQMHKLCKNDGLYPNDVESWFFPNYKKQDEFKGIIIHFTKFRY